VPAGVQTRLPVHDKEELLMKKRTVMYSLLTALALITAGCLNLTYVTEQSAPAIRLMATSGTVGIVPFNVTIEMNHHILATIGDMEGAILVGETYGGVDKQVMVVVKAPDAATRYYVTADKLSILGRDVWADYLSGNQPFDYTGVDDHWRMERIMSQDEAGVPMSGFPETVAVSERLFSLNASPPVVRDLAGRYGVGALLACDMTVYAEVIKATDEENEDPAGPAGRVSLARDQYAVTVEIDYEWALFDGRTGEKIADSTVIPLKFFNPENADKTIFPLPLSIRRPYELERFLASREYETYFRQSIVNELQPYLYLFTPHYRGHYVEVEPEAD